MSLDGVLISYGPQAKISLIEQSVTNHNQTSIEALKLD